MKAGDRVRKRGYPYEGAVERVAPLGVWVTWDDGPAPKVRPKLCARGELEVISSPGKGS